MSNKNIEKGDIVVAHNGIFQVKSVDNVNNTIIPVYLTPNDATINNTMLKQPVNGTCLPSMNIRFADVICKRHDFYHKYRGNFSVMYVEIIKKHMEDLINN